MSLHVRLQRIKEAFAKKAPDAVKAVMHRATEELRDEAVLGGVIGEGASLPPFTLADSDGTPVASAALLAKGPLVLSFYRGKW